MTTIQTTINPEDKRKGVVGYYMNVTKCPICKSPTNLMFRVNEKRLVACSQECANDLYDRKILERSLKNE